MLTAVDDVRWIATLRENFGSLRPVPAMIARFTQLARRDVSHVADIRTATDAAAWLHRIGGAVRVFGPSPMALRLDRLEQCMRGDAAHTALAELPVIVAELESFMSELEALARALPTSD
jgi:hypothetical protein